MKLSELIDEYIANNAKYLKERTVMRYADEKKRLIRYFGDCDIEKFTQNLLQEKINFWQEREGITRKTCQNRLSLLMVALKPYKKFDRFRYIRVTADGKEKKIYSDEDIRKIVGYCLERPRIGYVGIMVAIFTGLRVAEICGLKWGDIDLDKKELTVRRNVFIKGGKVYVSTPKTRSGTRTVAMPDTL